jgi:predicted RNA binding protein YcfA (HicA-like mRNA interferase family)
MVKPSKILDKILSGSKNIRFEELVTLLNGLGFILKRVSGSHHIFKHPDVPEVLSIQPDKNGQAKPYQMKQLLEMIETYDLTLEESAE